MLASEIQFNRTTNYKTSLVALAVVGLHVFVLWAIQQSAMKSLKPAEIVIPITLNAIQPTPKPKTVAQPEPKPELKPEPKPKPEPRPKAAPKVEPTPIAVPAPVSQPVVVPAPVTTAIGAPVASSANAEKSSSALTAGSAASTQSAPPSPAPASPNPSKTLPSSYADDTYTPEKSYPRFSIKMGEEGDVTVRVFIGIDGLPKKAELLKSSGFERLDEAALNYVMQSRYKAGAIDGAPAAMWMGRTVRYRLKP